MTMVGDMRQYTQFQVGQSIPIAAANEGGGAGLGAGLGAGMAMGKAMADAMAPSGAGVTNQPAACDCSCPGLPERRCWDRNWRSLRAIIPTWFSISPLTTAGSTSWREASMQAFTSANTFRRT